MIYGILNGNLFTDKGRKTIRSDDFWKVGKHDNNDSNFITIYFNDDTYTSLSSTTDKESDSIIQLSSILQYLDIV